MWQVLPRAVAVAAFLGSALPGLCAEPSPSGGRAVPVLDNLGLNQVTAGHSSSWTYRIPNVLDGLEAEINATPVTPKTAQGGGLSFTSLPGARFILKGLNHMGDWGAQLKTYIETGLGLGDNPESAGDWPMMDAPSSSTSAGFSRVLGSLKDNGAVGWRPRFGPNHPASVNDIPIDRRDFMLGANFHF